MAMTSMSTKSIISRSFMTRVGRSFLTLLCCGMLTKSTINRYARRRPHTPWRYRPLPKTWWDGCSGRIPGAHGPDAHSRAEHPPEVSAVLEARRAVTAFSIFRSLSCSAGSNSGMLLVGTSSSTIPWRTLYYMWVFWSWLQWATCESSSHDQLRELEKAICKGLGLRLNARPRPSCDGSRPFLLALQRQFGCHFPLETCINVEKWCAPLKSCRRL